MLYLQLNNIQNTLLRFCSNNGQANQSQCYTTHTLLICLRSSITSCIPKYSHKNENSKAGKLSTLNRDHNNKDINKKRSVMIGHDQTNKFMVTSSYTLLTNNPVVLIIKTHALFKQKQFCLCFLVFYLV